MVQIPTEVFWLALIGFIGWLSRQSYQLGSIKSTLEGDVTRLKTDVAKHDEKLIDHDRRIQRIEDGSHGSIQATQA